MNEMLRPVASSSSLAAAYAKDGFFFPYDVVSQAEAAEILADLEAGEAQTSADRAKLSMLRGYPARLLPSFDRLTRHSFVLFFEPPSIDERIVNQFALFSVMNGPALRLDEFLQDQKQGVRRLIIPAALKWEVRDKLDQANVTERVLFPGLDGLSRWLRRYYSPRPR